MREQLIELFIEEHGLELDRYIYNNLFHKGYFDDFRQEVYLKLLQVDAAKLIELFVADGTLNYAKRICLNMFNNVYQPFHKLIRQQVSDYEVPNTQIDLYDYETDDKLEKLVKIMNQPDFFIQLYCYYITHKVSIAKMSKDLNISKDTICSRFDDVKEKIRKQV